MPSRTPPSRRGRRRDRPGFGSGVHAPFSARAAARPPRRGRRPPGLRSTATNVPEGDPPSGEFGALPDELLVRLSLHRCDRAPGHAAITLTTPRMYPALAIDHVLHSTRQCQGKEPVTVGVNPTVTFPGPVGRAGGITA